MIIAYDHVQLAVPPDSEDALRTFYSELLGMAEIPKPTGLAPGYWFSTGQVQVHLGVEEDFHPSKKAHAAFRVSDVDTLAARLAGHGTEVNWADGIPGVRRFHSQDPVGNRLEFLELLG